MRHYSKIPTKTYETLEYIRRNWLCTTSKIRDEFHTQDSLAYRRVIWLQKQGYIGRTKNKGWYLTARGLIYFIDMGVNPKELEREATEKLRLIDDYPWTEDEVAVLCEYAASVGKDWKALTSREELLMKQLHDSRLLSAAAMNRRAKIELQEKLSDAEERKKTRMIKKMVRFLNNGKEPIDFREEPKGEVLAGIPPEMLGERWAANSTYLEELAKMIERLQQSHYNIHVMLEALRRSAPSILRQISEQRQLEQRLRPRAAKVKARIVPEIGPSPQQEEE